MKLAIASDHAGFKLKEIIKHELMLGGHMVIDCGTDSESSVDYPDYTFKVVKAIENHQAQMGVLICGSGIGMSIAANRSKYIRAALCHTPSEAELARQHNDANVLVLGSRIIDIDTAKQCLDKFLHTDFEGGRHQLRVNKLGEIR